MTNETHKYVIANEQSERGNLICWSRRDRHVAALLAMTYNFLVIASERSERGNLICWSRRDRHVAALLAMTYNFLVIASERSERGNLSTSIGNWYAG